MTELPCMGRLFNLLLFAMEKHKPAWSTNLRKFQGVSGKKLLSGCHLHAQSYVARPQELQMHLLKCKNRAIGTRGMW